jgi:hypothetical protein
MNAVHSPPNEQLRIDEVYLFVSSDEAGEGVCSAFMNGVWMPLMAADEKRLKIVLPIARQVAKESGKSVKLIKLSARSDIMTITPDGGTTQ